MGELGPGATLLGGQDLTCAEVALVVVPDAVRLAEGEVMTTRGLLSVTDGYPRHSLMYVQPPARLVGS